MNTILTFIIPIRHQDNAPDWSVTTANLKQTISSIAAQTDKDWRAIIVANHGADLPEMPEGFEICRVDFSPNKLHEQGSATKEEFYDAIRLDKGRRVLSGMLQAQNTKFFMVVDDDDFVRRDLCAYAKAHQDSNGWYFDDGYVWGEGGNLLLKHKGFNHFCGTSHIIRKDHLIIQNNFDDNNIDYIKTMFGSHIKIQGIMEENGTPLVKLPFVGAIYRIGHTNSHSRSKGLISHYFGHKWLLKKPKELLKRLISLRYLNTKIRSDFFGAR